MTSSIPTLDSGSLFRDAQDSGQSIWERVTTDLEKVRIGDYLADLEVRGISQAKHDDKPATRLELVQHGPQGERLTYHGRLVLQQGAEITVERVWDPKNAETSTTVELKPGHSGDVLNQVFQLISGLRLTPNILEFAEGGVPIVKLTGTRDELGQALYRHDPSGYLSPELAAEDLMPTSDVTDKTPTFTCDISDYVGMDPLGVITDAVRAGLTLGVLDETGDLFSAPTATGTQEQFNAFLQPDEDVGDYLGWVQGHLVTEEAENIEDVPETVGQAYPQLPWQKAATEKALGDRTWRPTRSTMSFIGARRNPWNQPVSEGWELEPTSGDETSRIYVGKQFMRLLFANYRDQLDLGRSFTV